MYTTYFIIGFVTSFGWWSAGKIQKAVDNTAVQISVQVQEQTSK
jgi:hypothetical protein